MIGRFIGVVFLLPFIYFIIKKRLSKKLVQKLLIACSWVHRQLWAGTWSRGPVNDPNVSHYRLAAHLIIAFGLYAYLLWVLLGEVYPKRSSNTTTSLLGIQVLIFFTVLQIVYGAFVSGLKAGLVYNTFPKMGTEWMAESVLYALEINGIISFFENLASVQLIHRYLGIIVLILVVYRFLFRAIENKIRGKIRVFTSW